MKFRHLALHIFALIVILGLVDVIGSPVFELVVIAYLLFYGTAAILLTILGIWGYKKDAGWLKFVSLLASVLGLGSIVVTLVYFFLN